MTRADLGHSQTLEYYSYGVNFKKLIKNLSIILFKKEMLFKMNFI